MTTNLNPKPNPKPTLRELFGAALRAELEQATERALRDMDRMEKEARQKFTDTLVPPGEPGSNDPLRRPGDGPATVFGVDVRYVSDLLRDALYHRTARQLLNALEPNASPNLTDDQYRIISRVIEADEAARHARRGAELHAPTPQHRARLAFREEAVTMPKVEYRQRDLSETKVTLGNQTIQEATTLDPVGDAEEIQRRTRYRTAAWLTRKLDRTRSYAETQRLQRVEAEREVSRLLVLITGSADRAMNAEREARRLRGEAEALRGVAADLVKERDQLRVEDYTGKLRRAERTTQLRDMQLREAEARIETLAAERDGYKLAANGERKKRRAVQAQRDTMRERADELQGRIDAARNKLGEATHKTAMDDALATYRILGGEK